MAHSLPDKDSQDIRLVVATQEELIAQQHANSTEWRGALSLDAYLRREEHLLNQALTKDGGLTPWMLVWQPSDRSGEGRTVLCGCESILKKALVARNGKVEDVVAHGVASVFCPPQYRGKGYAGRMMTEVGKKLEKWQVPDGGKSAFSILFSDIGKEFYKARGWEVFPSAHITLPADASSSGSVKVDDVKLLQDDDLDELCRADEELLRRRMAESKNGRTMVAVVPNVETLAWHQAREDFVSTELHGGKRPEFMKGGRGGLVRLQDGKRVWCYWTRVWTNPQEHAPNKLHVLRLVVEDDNFFSFEAASEEESRRMKQSTPPVVSAVAQLLSMAQQQAHASGMKEVQLWNPSSLALAAARLLRSDTTVVHREKESIASLRWYGDGSCEEIDWVCNEKYGWC